MKIMNLIKRKYENVNDGSNQGNPADNQNPDANQDKNNTPDNVDDYSNIWNTNSDDNQNPNDPPVQQVKIINQQNVNELTPAQKLQAHIESLNLLDGFDPAALTDPETAMKAMQQIQANTYAAAMKDASTIMDQRMDAFREEMQENTQTMLNGNSSISTMNSALPYTSKPQFKPVAEALLTKFQKQGKTAKEATVEVGKYFMQLQQEVSATIPNNPNNRLNGNSFNDNVNSSNSDNAGSEVWMDFLTAK